MQNARGFESFQSIKRLKILRSSCLFLFFFHHILWTWDFADDCAYTWTGILPTPTRRACSCNCTPTRPTTVGYRLDLDNDSPSGHRALTVSPSPRIFLSASSAYLLLCTFKRYSSIDLYSMYNPYLRISIYPRISSHWHGVNFQWSVYVHNVVIVSS